MRTNWLPKLSTLPLYNPVYFGASVICCTGASHLDVPSSHWSTGASHLDVPSSHWSTSASHLDVLLTLVHQRLVEVQSILLFSHIDALTPQLEDAPEALRYVVLKLALQQVAEHLLGLVQHTRGQHTSHKQSLIACIQRLQSDNATLQHTDCTHTKTQVFLSCHLHKRTCPVIDISVPVLSST